MYRVTRLNNVLTVALAEPSNLFLVEEIRQLTGFFDAEQPDSAQNLLKKAVRPTEPQQL